MGKSGILDYGNSADGIINWRESDMPYDQKEKSDELFDRGSIILAGIADYSSAVLWGPVFRNWCHRTGCPVRMHSSLSAGIKR